MKHVKTVLTYLLILVAGLGTGLVVANAPKWFKKPYVEGNYAQYYPDAQTKVVMYGTQSCPYCGKARELLRAKNVRFADLDVQHSPKAQKEFEQLGGTGVPVILIGNRRIQGFNQDAIEEALEVVTK